MADFKKSTVYQIYPKSFYDTDGDGYGDLKGIIEKLEYVKTLGCDYIWITPFFLSPQKDNGYDVADYYAIDPRYGTMEDFRRLAEKAESLGIGLMLDMVFNHTSDQHEWFQRALAGEEKYKHYYIFKKGRSDGLPPTNWQSKFGGSAWRYVPEMDEYYLHLFDESQPDLNWDNEEVRKQMQKILRFWMDQGVRGFRFDVVNLISKDVFEDDHEGDGRRFYTDGPNVHRYLQELNAAAFGTDPQIVTVGEMSSTSMENCYRYASEDGKEFSMVFSFHHLKVDFAGNDKWVNVPFDFQKLKEIFFSWQTNMAANHAWNAVFWCNHDQPRVVSRFGSDTVHHKESAKMLGTAIHCLRGTPYIYQGEELGMTNPGFTHLDQYRDVESLNHFRILTDQGLSEEEAYEILRIHSRDNGRTPMQWENSAQGGFTNGEPWIEVQKNYDRINAREEMEDPDSVFHHYRKLVRLRKEYDVIAYGEVVPIDAEHPAVFAYERNYEEQKLLVINHFYEDEITWRADESLEGYRCLLSNYRDQKIAKDTIRLRPYESVVLYRENSVR